jgi:hypothetical protein
MGKLMPRNSVRAGACGCGAPSRLDSGPDMQALLGAAQGTTSKLCQDIRVREARDAELLSLLWCIRYRLWSVTGIWHRDDREAKAPFCRAPSKRHVETDALFAIPPPLFCAMAAPFALHGASRAESIGQGAQNIDGWDSHSSAHAPASTKGAAAAAWLHATAAFACGNMLIRHC